MVAVRGQVPLLSPTGGVIITMRAGGGQEDLGEEKVGRIATLPTTDGYLVRETMVVVWPPLARWPNVFTFLFYLVFFFFPSRFMYTPPFRITRPR